MSLALCRGQGVLERVAASQRQKQVCKIQRVVFFGLKPKQSQLTVKPTARPGQIHNWSSAAHHISLLFLGHSNTNTQSQERSRLKTSPDFASNSCFKAQQVGLLQLPSALSLQLGRMFNNATGVALLTYDNTYMAAPNYLLSKRQKMFVSGFVFDFSILLVGEQLLFLWALLCPTVSCQRSDLGGSEESTKAEKQLDTIMAKHEGQQTLRTFEI